MPPYAQQNAANLKALCAKYPDSEQSHDIWDAVVNGTTRGVQVDALAGVGKTFTSVKGAGLVQRSTSVILLSFNKPIQVEAERKLKEEFGQGTTVQAKTFNAAGFKAVMDQWTFLRGMDINPDRTWQMLPTGMPAGQRSTICKLVALCKNTLTQPTRDNLLDLALTYDIDLSDETAGGDWVDVILDTVPEILEQSKTPTPETGIDFNDQVWLPVIWQLPVRTYGLVIVDEAQDLNNCRMRLAYMLAGRNGRIMFVGDKHQAIYGFSGSNVRSMQEFAELIGDVTVLPLTVTRRCPQFVTYLAAQIVPNFTCLPDAPDGEVCVGDYRLARDPSTQKIVPIPQPDGCPNPDLQKGEMVLCRTNAPLVSLAYECIRENKAVKIQGRELGEDMVKHINKLVKANATIPELEEAESAWAAKERERLVKLYGEGSSRLDDALARLQDKTDVLYALCEGLRLVSEVVSRIKVLFADVQKGNTSEFILLSTVHKAKGLESKVVRIIEPQLMPLPNAKLAWQKEQEMNLKYVAITRSLHTLHIH